MKFAYNIVSALINADRIVVPVGQPNKGKSTELEVIQRSPAEPEPAIGIRYDNISHWPKFGEDKRKCRLCKTGQSSVCCQKYKICLSLSHATNCFTEYHTK